MEIKEVERIAIAKPVASKPSFSKFRSFSELLAGAINASPSPANVCTETAMAAAIRPKTIRVKPTLIAPPSSQGEASGTKNPAQIKSSVVYKPLAKAVSKATVSLLATMGGPSITHQQVLAQVEARAQHLSQSKPMSIVPAQAEKVKATSEAVEDEPKPLAASANVDRASYDGYNWRKYGQKQVKGSEYPRSYYKCTHPNCPVKKKVERLLDGQIAEIVYKGEHSHPKPLPPKKSSSQDARSPKSSNHICESNEASEEGHVQNHGVLPTQSTYLRKPRQLSHNQGTAGAYHNGVGAPDDSCVPCEETSKGLEVEHDDEPRSKRRKSRNQNNEAGKSGEVVVPVQTAVLGDGFRWRKYGQKVVKGNPNPRSYYKCTSLKCDVRKHVERTTDDPKAFVTTYEGKHNHDMPLSK